MANIFHFGLPQCILFCCLFVAKLPLTFAKLNSIPLNRARGPLNDLCEQSSLLISDSTNVWVYHGLTWFTLELRYIKIYT